MTTTMVEKLITDAKELTIRLKKRDTLTDMAISTTLGVQQKLHAMKQYQEIVDKLNKTASHRPKMVLIQKLNKMNSKIEELKRDNSELQQSLEEHHEMLELIMSKYKQQRHKLASTAHLEATAPVHSHLKETEAKDRKIREMVSVMMLASDKWSGDEELIAERHRLIALLQQKNQLMRMVLLNTPDHMLASESSLLESKLFNGPGAVIGVDALNVNNTNNNDDINTPPHESASTLST